MGHTFLRELRMPEMSALDKLVALRRFFENHRAVSYDDGLKILDVVAENAEVATTELAEFVQARAELDALKAKVREYFEAREDYSQYYAESRMPQYRLEKHIAMENAEAALREAVK